MLRFDDPHTLLLQNRMTVDGIWSAVGSTSFDGRSFDTNDEITLGICCEGIAKQLDAVFEKCLARCTEVKLDDWKKRGLWHKIKNNAFYLIKKLLSESSSRIASSGHRNHGKK